MSMLVEPLALSTPIAAFNGGLVVEPDLDVVEERVVRRDLVAPTIELIESFELSVWVYRGADWLVLDPDGPHVDREAHTVQFEPTVVASFEGIDEVAKIVGVSDDYATVAAAANAAHERVRRRRLRLALPAVLPRRDASRREQGRRRRASFPSGTASRPTRSRPSATCPTTS